jgi:Xaa-Pro aminopeptidase
MLTSKGCASRRGRLWEAVSNVCDAVVVTSPESLIHLGNFAPSPFDFNPNEGASALLLTPDRAILFADNLLGRYVRPDCVDEVVTLDWYTGRKSAPARRELLSQAIRDRLADGSARRLGVEPLGVPLIENHRQINLAEPLRDLRRSKDPDELDLIRRSVKAGEAGHRAGLAEIVPGMTELDAYLVVQNAAIRELGERAIVYGDFASGRRCELELGGPPTGKRIERGDLMILDFSVVVHGYRADFTNTFCIGASPTDRQAELYQHCMEAMKTAEAILASGVPARRIDAAVRGVFARHGLAGHFPTHSGHGLGLGHPEPPYLVPESADVLRAGDVIAIEPGLYLEGVGGMRFERNYLITEAGAECLTYHRLTLTS